MRDNNRTGAQIADELVAHVVNSNAEGFFMPVEVKCEGLMDGETLFVMVSRRDIGSELTKAEAERDTALARVKELEQSAWRPIESAPKDGTGVLLWNGGGVIHARWGGSFHNAWIFAHGIGFCDHATHWQPLPPPPAAADSHVATGTEAKVCADIAARQQKGIAKYGTTVAENPAPLAEWLQHTYEELLDAAVYLKRAMADSQKP